MSLQVPNSVLSTTPINDQPGTATQPSTDVFYMPNFQIATSSTPILPANISQAQTVYIKNLDPANPITVVYTAVGFSSTSIVLPAGAVFLYFSPEIQTGGGISAIAATATSATVAAEVFLGY